MPKQLRVFYAFPNEPPHIGETIKGAVSKLKSDGELRKHNLSFKLWNENSISGKQLISSVLSQIDRCSIFACDLTYPNPNVSFELGYSIAKFKRVSASLSPTVRRRREGIQTNILQFVQHGLHGFREPRPASLFLLA